MTITILTASGTWAPWDIGYPADVARGVTSEWDTVYAEIMGLDGPKYRWQPIGYRASGFLNPDPNTSYKESVATGVAEGVRLIRGIPGPIILIGYSQGAEVVIRIAAEFLPGGQLGHRGADLVRMITFGSPCRPPGPTLLGNNPPGSGISRLYTPPEFRPITYDYLLPVLPNGPLDMYACAEADTLLPEFYGLLTQAEVSVEFALALFRIIGTAVALGMLGAVAGGAGGGLGFLLNAFGSLFGGRSNTLAGTLDSIFTKGGDDATELTVKGILSDIPGALKTASIAGNFVARNPHIHYHDWPDFGGRPAVHHAIDGLRQL